MVDVHYPLNQSFDGYGRGGDGTGTLGGEGAFHRQTGSPYPIHCQPSGTFHHCHQSLFPALVQSRENKEHRRGGPCLVHRLRHWSVFSGRHLDNTHPARLAGRVCRNDNAVVNGTVVLLFPARRPIPLDGTVRRDEPDRRSDRHADRRSAGQSRMELCLPCIFNGTFCAGSCASVPAQ